MKDALLGLLRHGLTTAGGAMASAGVITAEDTTTIVGAVMALIGVGFSMYDKRKKA